MYFQKGQIYKRSDIHDKYRGSRGHGISHPANGPVIFAFSKKSTGSKVGYVNEWEGEEYHYTGEGLVGDQSFTSGNAKLRDHVQDGRLVYIFEEAKQRSYYQFIGSFELLDYYYSTAIDENKNNRKIIRFRFVETANYFDFDQPLVSRANVQKQTRKGLHNPPNTTERRGLVTSRVGQGQYRKDLLQKFDCKCAVTGCAEVEILIASHIVPWRDSTDEERLDPDNGILLSPIYDALFDKYLISFSSDGRMVVSKKITQSIECLGIDPKLTIEVSEGMVNYLARHREQLR